MFLGVLPCTLPLPAGLLGPNRGEDLEESSYVVFGDVSWWGGMTFPWGEKPGQRLLDTLALVNESREFAKCCCLSFMQREMRFPLARLLVSLRFC